MKTALIIDDSRVARAVLRKTLVGFGIEVDEVPSAEAAIEYLKVDSPDVIFLDHMMPGMDGFDTLSALKANPVTATIPVLMYTAQEGQFYVSQARALGAVDVLPKNLAPADVERLLRSHHLIGGPAAERPERSVRPPSGGDQHELVERFRTLLDERTVMLMAEIRRELGRTQLAYEYRLAQIIEESRPKSRHAFSTGLALAASIGMGALLVGVGVPHLREHESAERAIQSLAVPAEAEAPRAAATVVPVALQVPPPLEPARSDVLASGWNVSRHFPYGTLPLDDARARELALLLAQLEQEGFSGTITFDIYEGRHCVTYSADGSAHLAPAELPATSCDQISTSGSFAAARLQSARFAELAAAAARDGRIRLDIVPHGVDEPLIDYPMLDYSVTAADWNAIADINQRVSMRVSRGDGVDAVADPGPPVAYLTY